MSTKLYYDSGSLVRKHFSDIGLFIREGAWGCIFVCI